MSNNKQTMKLYTEEEVYKAMMIRENQRIGFTTIMIEHLTPIELPSDEEIGKEFKHSSENWEVRQALEVGAKWMRDKIGGNNEQ